MARKRHTREVEAFVLDSSVTMAWYFKDEANAYAQAVRKSLAKRSATVAGLWPLEIANTLVSAERRQRSTELEATKWLGFLSLLPIHVDGELAARAWAPTLQIARQYNLSAYDASYLELAMRLGVPLASLDNDLKAAAAKAGVSKYEP
ncbi:MAG: type II toxin-antitoxin system VapC family toxin [Gemmataceae bacterium]